MLVLARSAGQSVVLDDRIIVTVIETSGGIVRLGIAAPPDVGVRRGELDRLTDAQRRARSAHPAGSRRTAPAVPAALVAEAAPVVLVAEAMPVVLVAETVPAVLVAEAAPAALTPVDERPDAGGDEVLGRSREVAEGVVDVTESRRKSSPSA